MHPTYVVRFLGAGLFFLLATHSAWATPYEMEDDLIGEISRHEIEENDNFYAIARTYDVGIVELLAANSNIDAWLPPIGTKLKIPTTHILPPGPREGIVINLAELRLFYYPGDDTVMTFPIGIGQEGWETPTGTTYIANKLPEPLWTPPASIRAEHPELPKAVEPGPENPLGAYALYLGWKRFLIHGTNRPSGVGKRSSHGCIRLYPEDIAELYDAVDIIGTPVTIIDTPYKLGWKDDVLYLEVTPTQRQSDDIAAYKKPEPVEFKEIYEAAKTMAGNKDIDRRQIEKATQRQDGIPVPITVLTVAE